MNRKIFILTILASVSFLPAGFTVSAQKPRDVQPDWVEKVKSEKVAFLTNAMELTCSEAEKFWPVYNQAEAEKRKSMETIMKAYRALDEAVKNDKDEKEVSSLLDRYLTALESGKELNQKHAAEYRKILPGTKVAKLFIGEESFRRQQIGRLHRRRKD